MDKEQFFSDVLRELGLTATPNRMAFFLEWARHENTKAKYNPLATTKIMNVGETRFNSAGVKNYPTYADGVLATAKTLKLRYYPAIINMLKVDADYRKVNSPEIVKALNTWGTVNFAKLFQPPKKGVKLTMVFLFLIFITILIIK